jgi:hypothetical protein
MRNYLFPVLLSGSCNFLLPRLLYAIVERYFDVEAKALFIYTAKWRYINPWKKMADVLYV